MTGSGVPTETPDAGRLTSFDAVVLAGGRASRLGGVSKPDVRVRGRRMLEHVLDAVAVAGARRVAVVGPPTLDVPGGVLLTLEDPPDGGPAAGVAAGLVALDAGTDRAAAWVLLLACDLPLVGGAVPLLLGAGAQGPDGAMLVDADGRDQPLVGIYRRAALDESVERLERGRGVRGAPVRAVLGDLDVRRLADADGAAVDVDTWEAVRLLDG
ncbi:molybdenum cofactor guanylyltransferase [Cellulomonas sp. P22]|uniref:molybdenum cofactor guanylyltransferase n=1 Tax=Cellulomonas sp. P22 TaxID=3373189 RepID=UPI0037B3D190